MTAGSNFNTFVRPGVVSRFAENKLLGKSHGQHVEDPGLPAQVALRAVPIYKRPRERETGR